MRSLNAKNIKMKQVTCRSEILYILIFKKFHFPSIDFAMLSNPKTAQLFSNCNTFINYNKIKMK